MLRLFIVWITDETHNYTFYRQSDIKPILTYRGHTLPVTSVVLSTEQSTCYSASMDATIRVWKIPANRELYAPVGKGIFILVIFAMV